MEPLLRTCTRDKVLNPSLNLSENLNLSLNPKPQTPNLTTNPREHVTNAPDPLRPRTSLLLPLHLQASQCRAALRLHAGHRLPQLHLILLEPRLQVRGVAARGPDGLDERLQQRGLLWPRAYVSASARARGGSRVTLWSRRTTF